MVSPAFPLSLALLLLVFGTLCSVSEAQRRNGRASAGSYIVQLPDNCGPRCVRKIGQAVKKATIKECRIKRIGYARRRSRSKELSWVGVRCSPGAGEDQESIAEQIQTQIRGLGYQDAVVEPNYILSVNQASMHWSLDEVDGVRDNVRCPSSNLGTGILGVVLDTGCVPTAPADVPIRCWSNLPPDGCQDLNGHGTRVSSVMSHPDVGVAPNLKIACVRIADSTGGADGFDVIEALIVIMDYADTVTTPIIINYSLISTSFSVTINSAFQAASAVPNIWITVAAGNQAGAAAVLSPSSAGDNVKLFAVAAHRFRFQKGIHGPTGFSNFGPPIGITAPGRNLRMLFPSGLIGRSSGTSYSSPMVAGAIAALLSDGKPVSLATLTSGSNDTITFADGSVVPRLAYECDGN